MGVGLSVVSQFVPLPFQYVQFHVPPVKGDALLFPKCQVSPPRNINPFPGAGVIAAQLAEQFGIPGA